MVRVVVDFVQHSKAETRLRGSRLQETLTTHSLRTYYLKHVITPVVPKILQARLTLPIDLATEETTDLI